jgi:ribose/xylose/arabinose/galactoside ABC-type transport system permease subunit
VCVCVYTCVYTSVCVCVYVYVCVCVSLSVCLGVCFVVSLCVPRFWNRFISTLLFLLVCFGVFHTVCFALLSDSFSIPQPNHPRNRQQKATIAVEDGDDDLSGGQIAGIVLGVLGAVVLALLLAVVVRLYMFKRSKNMGDDLEGYMAPGEDDANVFSPLHEDD